MAGPYMRGRVVPKNLEHLKQLSVKRHPHLPATLAAVPLPSSWDSRALPTGSVVPPLENQGSCGTCWLFSGVFFAQIALIMSKMLSIAGDWSLSKQYMLDCQQSGGCNGDDNTNPLRVAKANGFPLTKDYGEYQAGPGPSCLYKPSMPLFKIQDWGFVDGTGNGVTRTDLIKAAVIQYGGVGCAVAAGSSWDNYTGGIHTGNSTEIDHDTGIVGWEDTATKVSAYLAADVAKVEASDGWWWMPNWWGLGWGEKGYMRIAYGADSIGTEAVFASGGDPPPPGPTPPPVPPGPVPPGPVPPGPIPPTPGAFPSYDIRLKDAWGNAITGTAVPQSGPTPGPQPGPAPGPQPGPGPDIGSRRAVVMGRVGLAVHRVGPAIVLRVARYLIGAAANQFSPWAILQDVMRIIADVSAPGTSIVQIETDARSLLADLGVVLPF